MSSLLYKFPSEVRVFSFDFSAIPEIKSNGDTITSVQSVTISPAGPTIGSASINVSLVQFTLSGGTAGVLHTLDCLIHTSSNAIVEAQGSLQMLAE